jgi:hypothetical protein
LAEKRQLCGEGTVMHKRVILVALVFALPAWARSASPDSDTAESWYFAVSGDSRNCGDVVMPAIAADALKHNVRFYWHLGDLRKISGPDEDFVQEQTLAGRPADLASYEKSAWDDFIENQVKPWGETPFFLGIGNHETTPPKSRADFTIKFRDYLDRTELKEQRLKDGRSAAQSKSYFHWNRDAVDFIYLDNATPDQFDQAQMKWIGRVLRRDQRDRSIRSVVVGMHAALPESISANHSMNAWPLGIRTGRQVYRMLLDLQNNAHKKVYVLASHSHFFMDGIFGTPYWKANGGVLPGWIIGGAGAERYPLPSGSRDAKEAKTNIYGFLVATVNPKGEAAGTIKFKFEEIKEDGIPDTVVQKFSKPFVHQCFEGNRTDAPVE